MNHCCPVWSPGVELRSGQKTGAQAGAMLLGEITQVPSQAVAWSTRPTQSLREQNTVNPSQQWIFADPTNKYSNCESRIIRNRLKQTIEQQTEFA